MNDQEKAQFVSLASKLLKEHLTLNVGYPKCTLAQIMNQLPHMWNVLVQQGLIRPGMTYNAFIQAAQEKYMQAEIDRILGL